MNGTKHIMKRKGLGEVSSSQAAGYASAGANIVNAVIGSRQKQDGPAVINYNGFRYVAPEDLEKGGVTSTIIKTAGGVAAYWTFGITLILTVVPSEVYEKTVARFFKNGLNPKCWGSSWAPSKAKDVLELEIPVIQNEAQKVIKAPLPYFEKAVNDFMVFFYAIHSTDRDWLKTSAKDCTKQGLQILIEGLDMTRAKMVDAFTVYAKKLGGDLQRVGTIKQTYPPEEHSGRHSLTQDVEQYRFIPPKNAVNTTEGGNNLADLLTGQRSEAGFNPITAILLAALAGGAFMYAKN